MHNWRGPKDSPYASAIESFSIAARTRDAREFPPPTAEQLFGPVATPKPEPVDTASQHDDNAE